MKKLYILIILIVVLFYIIKVKNHSLIIINHIKNINIYWDSARTEKKILQNIVYFQLKDLSTKLMSFI